MINIEYDWPIEKDHINIDDRMFFSAVFQNNPTIFGFGISNKITN